jgi:cob(I)alamin adenosyltransferase
MPRITKATTRRGDDGSTDLAGGERIPKDSPRIQAVGAVDELNSAIGLALAFSPQAETARRLRGIQNELFHLGAMLSQKDPAADDDGPRLAQRHVDALELEIQSLQDQLVPLENFILPGGTTCACALHLARTVCRRAERELVALSRVEPLDAILRVYLNRLSDLLFLLARRENKSAGASEQLWDSRL